MTQYVIETSNLTRSFKQFLAVDALNLNVPKGCIYGFIGPNGAGKTTTIKLLIGLLRAHMGEIKLLGCTLKGELGKVLKRIGVLIETPSLYPNLTASKNLEISCLIKGVDKSEIGRVLELVKLENVSQKLVRKFSQGMKQRLGIALALIGNPELLILDEPFTALDPQGTVDMRNLMLDLTENGKCSIFLSSHLLNEVQQIAHQIGIINQGKLLFQGSIKELPMQQSSYVQIEVDPIDDGLKILLSEGKTACKINDNTLQVLTKNKIEASEINSLLVAKGITVYNLQFSQDSLEDIFLRILK